MATEDGFLVCGSACLKLGTPGSSLGPNDHSLTQEFQLPNSSIRLTQSKVGKLKRP